MGEYLIDDHRILNAGDHLDGAAAGTAGLYVDIEHALEPLRPTHGRVTFPRRCLLLFTGVFGRVAPAPPGRRHL